MYMLSHHIQLKCFFFCRQRSAGLARINESASAILTVCCLSEPRTLRTDYSRRKLSNRLDWGPPPSTPRSMDTASPQAEGSVANLSNNAPSSYPQREGIWPNGPVQLARGRQAKDPNAKTVEYTVNSLDDFEESLREYLNGPPEDPEHTECHIYFWVGASFLVHYRPPGQQQQSQQQTQQQQQQSHQQPPSNHAPHSIPAHNAPPGYQPAEALDSQYGSHAPHSYHALNEPSLDLTLPYHAPPANPAQPPTPVEPLKANQKPEKIPMSIIEALTPTSEPKERMHKQRSIAKACVDAIQRVDGFRYSFHNTWASREDDSWRFSYYCNDSLLNKDRAANGKGAKMGKRATKSVWDCKGVLRVLFSATKQTVHVTYKHMPVHKTYAERAPPPRRDSKRRREQLNNPEGLAQIGDRSRSMSSSARPAIDLTGSAEPASASRTKTKKRKPTAEPKNATTSIENDLRNNSLRSLLELALPPEIVVPDQTQQSPAQAQAPGQIANNAVPGVEAASQPARQNPVQTQPARRRPRNSCDVCNRKKTRVSPFLTPFIS